MRFSSTHFLAFVANLFLNASSLATVVHTSAMWADALATAINVLGPERGLAFARARGLAVLLVVHGAQGFEERYTETMRGFML